MKSNRYIYLFFAFSLFAGIGCSRPIGNDASVSLASGNSSMAAPNGYNIRRIMVNVRGTGIASPIFYAWNAEGPGGVLQSPPTEISIKNIPSGSDRLIQYLAVYENEDEETLFYYGDKQASLTSGPNSVEVVANQMGAGTTETGLLGRYIRADGSFPTGKVRIEFTPPNGRPNMTVDFKEVFGGWMSLFTFSGVYFTFTMVDTSEVLFQNITSSTLRPVGIGTLNPHSLLVQLPGHFKDYGNACSNEHYNATRKIIFGYFGPGSVGKKVCYSSTTPLTTGLYTRSGSDCGSPISWNTSLIAEDNASYGVVLGGFASTDSSNVPSCGDAPLANEMKFPYQSYRNGGKDEILSEGPYRKVGGNAISFNGNDTTNLTLNWYYMAGALTGPQGIKGTEIYKKAYTGPGGQSEARRYSEEGATCSESATKAGYSFVAAVPSATEYYAVLGSLPADDKNGDGLYNEGDYQFVLCPYYEKASGEKTYYSSLAESYTHPPLRAKLQSSPMSLAFPPTVAPGYVNDMIVTLTNVGSISASSMSGSNSNSEFKFVGGAFPGTSGTCSPNLIQGSNCTIAVRFEPLAVGSRSGQITINYNNGNGMQSLVINASGSGTPPMAALTVAPSFFDFGYYSPGSTYNGGPVTVTNTGTGPATGISFSGLAATPFATNPGFTCAYSLTTLNPGETCTIAFTYTASPSENASATLTINYMGGLGPTFFNISGRTVP